MKKKIVMVILAGVMLSGCVGGGATEEVDLSSINETLTGELSAGTVGSYLLQQGPGVMTELHDGNTSLEGYVGKRVEVTGQYSGTTLYVDEVVVK